MAEYVARRSRRENESRETPPFMAIPGASLSDILSEMRNSMRAGGASGGEPGGFPFLAPVGAMAGEMKRPEKDLPKAIILGLSFVTVVYLLTSFPPISPKITSDASEAAFKLPAR